MKIPDDDVKAMMQAIHRKVSLWHKRCSVLRDSKENRIESANLAGMAKAYLGVKLMMEAKYPHWLK